MVPDTPIPDRAGLADANVATIWAPLEALRMLNMIIGDAVLIWRTWVVYQGRILAIFLPCILLLVSFVFTLIDITCLAYDGPLPGVEQICPKAAILAWALSVGTNVTCTILVGFKAWHVDIFAELNLPGKPHRIATEKILLTFVDSGFIYSLLWLSQVIGYLNYTRDSPWQYVYEVLVSMGYQITGIYPTLVIVIVNFQRPIWEETRSFTSSNGVPFATLPWNAKQSGSTDTSSAHNRVDLDITRENSMASRSVKWSPFEDV
ncbi:hypothetical protein DFH08DRAFT_677236 [Mycena albidolilacea]|uniref:Uncharacterized protein n=1 Tax=Mycena albidolilacea TaxID=1033008 RepID=A0AAD7F5L8_9AGAR|nr:hypothetical protein DFH08DRAFT_677236 [Mycena albidolilacea]